MYLRLDLRRLLSAGGLASLLLLSGCSTVRTSPPSAEDAALRWQARQIQLAGIERFSMAGRIGVQSDQEGWHVAVRWRQDGSHFHMVFNAPLGQGSAVLEGDEREVTLTLADGQRWTATDAEKLVTQALGSPLPVSGLRYWVRGLPVPEGAAIPVLDDQGRLQSLEQAGWRITYRAYRAVDGRDVPTKLFMENDKYKVRLVIDTWTLS